MTLREPGWSPCWPQGPLDPAMGAGDFCAKVWEEGMRLYRSLPWRNIDDPYAVLVSEVMLQQTQVSRVLGYWPRFLETFPTCEALAKAPTSQVLGAWQGLGYNRRALALQRAAQECVAANGGTLPQGTEDLLALPGIGPATAAGVRAFAHNLPGVYLETNVRTVFLHLLFPEMEKVTDKALGPYVDAVCPPRNARAWYYALLDFGAHLKTQVGNPSRRSAHYSRQSTFEGSRRQKRANLLRVVLESPGITLAQAKERLDAVEVAEGREAVDEALFASVVESLVAEGFFPREGDVLG